MYHIEASDPLPPDPFHLSICLYTIFLSGTFLAMCPTGCETGMGGFRWIRVLHPFVQCALTRHGKVTLEEAKTLRVLVIETDESFRQKIAHHLRLDGCTVIEACEETPALGILRKKDVDVVLLGLHGFRTTALALLREIKLIRPAIEVILMNVSDELTLSMEAMKLGAFDDLWAPIEMETLVARVREAHERKGRRERPAGETREGGL